MSVEDGSELWLRRCGLAYAVTAFVAMWVFWTAFVIFIGNLPKASAPWLQSSIDSGATLHPLLAAAVDVALIALFGLQHSLMARPWFKRWWTQWVPVGLERATYVHAANAAGFLIIICWQPIPDVLWHVKSGPMATVLWLLFAAGWLILLLGALSFDLVDLLGLRQAWAWFRQERPPAAHLKTHGAFKWVRHPMYLGLLLGVWATPRMTVGHALLALGFTLYILVAMRFEERDLAKRFGCAYQAWRSRPVRYAARNG